jgi:hypothetical protein
MALPHHMAGQSFRACLVQRILRLLERLSPTLCCVNSMGSAYNNPMAEKTK